MLGGTREGLMVRVLAGAVVGAIVWFVAVTILNLGLRYGWPAYHTVEKSMAFTLPMMIARLSESGISSIACGFAAALIGRDRLQPSALAGMILLFVFLPVHYSLWSKFPIWYHLTFLISLVVMSLLGGRLAPVRKRRFQSA
jgi:hypothetical protein